MDSHLRVYGDFKIRTFGCRLNSSESDAIEVIAREAGIRNAIVFNSCAVTSEAVRKVKQSIRKERNENPTSYILVTGCAAQINPQEFSSMPEVDMVFGNREKIQPKFWKTVAENQDVDFSVKRKEGCISDAKKVHVADIMESSNETENSGWFEKIRSGQGLPTKRTRAYVQVQMGCDHRCTFCIIPYGRGPSRFIPEGRVIDQVQTFVQQGYSEIVLTGVNITSWGMDCEEKKSLGDLVQKILHAVPDLQRLRLSSVDCAEIDCCLLDTMKYEPRLLPYFHFSLQSGDNMILKRMKRRHSREEALLVCAELLAHRKDAVFGADIITGFPTETEEHFQNSLALVSECHLTFLHVFPYSPRQGTPAARMPQVSRSLAKERAERLRDAGQRNKEIWLGNQIGKMAKILVERNGTGRTETFAEVVFAEKKESGSIVNTKILAADSQYLYA